MNALLVSALCATALNVRPAEAPKDTIDKYYIDRKEVADFNGRQLEGKTIDTYFFAWTHEGDVVNRLHIIKTKETPSTLVIDPKETDKQGGFTTEALILVDGAEMPAEKFSEFNPNDIASITVHKPGSKVAQSYGEKGKKGVIIILSKAGKVEKKVTYYIDGKPVDRETVSGLNPVKIVSMTSKKKDGETIIEISTKK